MPTDELTLTPDDARRLLRQAAGTIEVSASPTDLPSRRRRLPRWLPAIAAAAAVLVIASGVLVWRALSPDSPPPPSSPPTETTVPAVFGYSREDAVALLEGLGLEVTVREVAGCGEPGRAVKTEPRTGLVADGRVTLEVSGPIAVNLDCAYEPELPLTWALVDFATGRGDAAQIPFADTVEVSYGAGRPREMTAAQAADPASWGPESPLGLLAAATLATRPSEEGGEETPQLINSIGYPTTARCLPTSLPPSPGEKRGPVSILVGFDGGSCLTTLDLYFSGPPVGLLPGSRIDKIVGSTPDTVGSSDDYRPGGDPGQAVRIPAVLGLSADEARSVLHGAGFVVHVERIPACDPRGVLDQAPAPVPRGRWAARSPSPPRSPVAPAAAEPAHMQRGVTSTRTLFKQPPRVGNTALQAGRPAATVPSWRTTRSWLGGCESCWPADRTRRGSPRGRCSAGWRSWSAGTWRWQPSAAATG